MVAYVIVMVTVKHPEVYRNTPSAHQRLHAMEADS